MSWLETRLIKCTKLPIEMLSIYGSSVTLLDFHFHDVTRCEMLVIYVCYVLDGSEY